jgi:aldose 1-epimerase
MQLIAIEAQNERALIVPEAGCQCFSYTVGALDVIAGPSSPEVWRRHPHRGGIPILFPWPGRIADARFNWKGREYRVPMNEPARGAALHGFACERAFKVVRRQPASISSMLDSADYPEIASFWPWPFALETEYEVGNGLKLNVRIRNHGDEPMPFGFGAHPYFHTLFGSTGERGAMLEIDAEARWPLDSRLLPTGPAEPLAGKYDLRSPRVLGSQTYDDVFRMEQSSDRSKPRARLMDPSKKVAFEVFADPVFRDFCVYAPPDSPVITIEPFTCGPDAFNLAARGIETGARELAPGETFSASFEIRVSVL